MVLALCGYVQRHKACFPRVLPAPTLTLYIAEWLCGWPDWRAGRNLDGQLGDTSKIDREFPVTVAGAFFFAQISAGGYHTCGVLINGTAACWGECCPCTPAQ